MPFVRVPAIEYHLIARVLDVGAMGVMVPMVSSAEQAAEIVSAVRYPPAGRRGFGLMDTADRDPAGAAETMRRAEEAVLAIAQIETVEGVEAADAIAAVDGIDSLWIGQSDLSNSLGTPGDFEQPAFHEAVATVRAPASVTARRSRSWRRRSTTATRDSPRGSGSLRTRATRGSTPTRCAPASTRCDRLGSRAAPRPRESPTTPSTGRCRRRFRSSRERASGSRRTTRIAAPSPTRPSSTPPSKTPSRRSEESIPVAGPIAVAVHGRAIVSSSRSRRSSLLHAATPATRARRRACIPTRSGDGDLPDRRRGRAAQTAGGPIRLPLRPMIGTLGVAPAGEPRPSFGQGTDILGNVDLPALTTGATVVMRHTSITGCSSSATRTSSRATPRSTAPRSRPKQTCA